MLMRSFAIRCAARAIAALALAGAAQTLAAAQLPDPQAILAESDAVRNPGKPFSLVVTLTEYTNGKQTDANALQAYSAVNRHSGQFRSLIRFVAPARDVNKLMLKTGNDLWFFDPASKASVRISPQQRLLGQASNGDVVTVNFAQSYKATLEAEEDVQDGDRKTRRAYKLALKSGAADDTYAAVEMWVETTTRRPIKARFFSDSGKLLKVAFYRRYREEMGALRPTEIVIIDGLNLWRPRHAAFVKRAGRLPRWHTPASASMASRQAARRGPPILGKAAPVPACAYWTRMATRPDRTPSVSWW